jgi:general L-amino acid transport system permease protein
MDGRRLALLPALPLAQSVAMPILVSGVKRVLAWRRDRRCGWGVGQVVFVLVLLWLAATLWHNLTLNLQRSGIQVGFHFIQSQASFDIGEPIIAYSPTDSFARALLVGLINTLRVAGMGIVLSTLVGLIIGLARLSDNWLIEQLAKLYVEVFRNTPLLLQLFVWYFAGFANLPAIDRHTPSSSLVYFTNRGLALTWLQPTAATGTWIGLLFLATLMAIGLWHWRQQLRIEQGIPSHGWLWSGGAIVVGSTFALTMTQTSPFHWDIPHCNGTELEGGLQLTPEFASLLLGLTLFIASFIAEIIRAGIQSVPKGQWEAAKSLGLKSGKILSQVVLPQALRVILPPLTSQYLNLVKGTSLAIAIGYPDLYFVATTIFNQTGRVVEVMVILMASYLGVNLIISLVMNLFNRSLQTKE